MGEASIWQPRTLLQLSSDTKRIEEKLTSTLGQTLFTLKDFTYVVDTGSLAVYLLTAADAALGVKGARLLKEGIDWSEGTVSTFSLTLATAEADQIIAVGYVAITGNVDIRDTDIFVANYQAIRDYAGTEITLYSQGRSVSGDGGEDFFQKLTGAAIGTFVDDNELIILPTGGDGSEGWQRKSLVAKSAFKADSLSAATLLNYANFDRAETASYLSGWSVTAAGPLGGAEYHADGTTGTVSTIYPNRDGFFDLKGKGFKLSTSQKFNFHMFGPAADGVTDDIVALQAAVNATPEILYVSDGTYFISDPGVNLKSDLRIEGTSKVFFKNERTFFDDTGSGTAKYTVGQGTVFKGTSLTNVHLKNITLIGSYDTAWGDQFVFANNVPAGSGSALLFLLTCTGVTLDNFHIIESFSSFVINIGDYEANTLIPNGYSQIQITSCNNVELLNCTWTLSLGEAWNLYDCNKVLVDGCVFDNDFGVSMLDITYSIHVEVTNSKFLKRLQSDSGDLLNVASAYVSITNCSLLNGSLDVGNEYLNNNTVLGASFQIENVTVANNSIYNGAVNMSMGTGANLSTLDWPMQNITVSDNTLIADLDDRPAANGSTVLNYSSINLPSNQDARNIKIHDNNITVRGALQANGASVNKWTGIRGLIDSELGDIRESISIQGNTIIADFTGYDSDDLNDVSGAIVTEFGVWNNLTIKGNTIDAPSAILINKHEAINGLTIADNNVNAESFLNMPLFAAIDTSISGMDIYGNSFTFYNTAGHTYNNSDIGTRGYGAFISMTVSPISLIERGHIRNNIIEAPSFAYITNATSSTSVESHLKIISNTTELVPYASSDGTTFTMNIGRADSMSKQDKYLIRDNYFKSTTPTSTGSITAQADGGGGRVVITSNAHGLSDGVAVLISGTTSYNGTFTVRDGTANTFEIIDTFVADEGTGTWDEVRSIIMTEFNQIDMMNNTFIGDYSFEFVPDNLAGDTTSRFIFKDNITVGATIATTSSNVNTMVSRLVRNNSTELDFSFAVTDTIDTIGVFYDDAASTFKAFDGAAYKTVAVT